MTWAEDQIVAGVREAVAEALKLSVDEAGVDAVLSEDLDATSIDFVDIMFRLETAFNVTFHSGNPLDRLSESFPGAELVRDGVLTDLGVEVVRRRIPEIDGSKVSPETPVGNVLALYTVGTWVRAVREILEARPDTCRTCGSRELRAIRPSVLECAGCSREVVCPTQADILDAWAQAYLRSNPAYAGGAAGT